MSALEPSPRPTREAPGSEALIRGGTFREAMETHERALLGAALKEAGGNQSEAARRLGMSRVTLIDRLKRLQIR